jgi:acetyl esterase/lipase
MHIIQVILQILAAVAGGVALLLSVPLFFAFRWPAAAMWLIKIIVSALSSVLAFIGVLITLVGLTTGALFITWMGLAVVAIYILHFASITRPPDAATGFEQAFGAHWENGIPPDSKTHFLSKRTALWLPSIPKPRLQQNIAFATIPGTGRKLLCDIWQPPKNINPSGLAFIFLHGSAFYFLDKDCGTRPFFSHLAAQGHVIMDVAYRLAPETDIQGMVHDVNRAIVWIKEQAEVYGIQSSRIVVGGGSAGGHLAMLAAYTGNDPVFIPPDLIGKDTSVCAVISLYGTSDLEAIYYHTNQHLTTRTVPGKPKKAVPAKMPKWMTKLFGDDYHRFGFDKSLENIGTLAPLLGGHPDECPERYSLFSPVTHVHAHCPPTLLIHGAHDIMAPLASPRRLYQRLLMEKVPAVLHVLPQTDHAFDVALPRIAPAAHNAIYDVERFMAFMNLREPLVKSKPTGTHKESFVKK